MVIDLFTKKFVSLGLNSEKLYDNAIIVVAF